MNSVLVPVQGFYVYYRATSTAGDYNKAIVDGQDARTFIVTHLSPDTSYDLKLQSFTVHEASNFSTILTHKTFGIYYIPNNLYHNFQINVKTFT